MQSSHANNLPTREVAVVQPFTPEDVLMPRLRFTELEVQTFRALLEEAVGHALSQPDEELEIMARNAVGLVLVLRDIARRRSNSP